MFRTGGELGIKIIAIGENRLARPEELDAPITDRMVGGLARYSGRSPGRRSPLEKRPLNQDRKEPRYRRTARSRADALCAGAAISARIARVVVGSRDERHGCLGSRYNLGADPRLNHELDVRVDVLAAECHAEFVRSIDSDAEMLARPA